MGYDPKRAPSNIRERIFEDGTVLPPETLERCGGQVVLAFNPLRDHECADTLALEEAAAVLRRTGGVENVSLSMDLREYRDRLLKSRPRRARRDRREAQ